MKLFVETIQAQRALPVWKAADGSVHLALTGNGTFIQMTPAEARALADKLHAAADQQEAA